MSAAGRLLPEVRDLGMVAPALEALAVGLATVAPHGDAVLAVAGQVVALLPGALAAPRAVVPPTWGAVPGETGLLVSGPGLDIIVDGAVEAPRSIFAQAGERLLLIAPSATEVATTPDASIGSAGLRVRLIEGATCLVDVSVPPGGAPRDHLDAAAVVARVEALGREVAARMAATPLDEGAGPSADRAGVDGAAHGGRDPGWMAAVAAAWPPTPALPRRASWAPTHAIVSDGSVPVWARPDLSAPAGTIEPGVQVRLVALEIGWANVDAVNGWRGWLDARSLARIQVPDAPLPSDWQPTHVISRGEPAPAWSRPDASAMIGAVPAGLPIRIRLLDRGWAQVDVISGWSAWIDARRLATVGAR